MLNFVIVILKVFSVKVVLSEFKPAAFSVEELLTAQISATSLCNVRMGEIGCSLQVRALSFFDVFSFFVGVKGCSTYMTRTPETLTGQTDLLRLWY